MARRIIAKRKSRFETSEAATRESSKSTQPSGNLRESKDLQAAISAFRCVMAASILTHRETLLPGAPSGEVIVRLPSHVFRLVKRSHSATAWSLLLHGVAT